MDFVADNLFDGRELRMLTVVDCYSRERLAIHVGQSLKGADVVRVLDAIAGERGKPRTVKTDTGSESIGKAMDRRAYETRWSFDFSSPGNPKDHAMIECLNGRMRQECLIEHWFLSLTPWPAQNRGVAQNEVRPHTALDWKAPREFAPAGQVREGG